MIRYWCRIVTNDRRAVLFWPEISTKLPLEPHSANDEKF